MEFHLQLVVRQCLRARQHTLLHQHISSGAFLLLLSVTPEEQEGHIVLFPSLINQGERGKHAVLNSWEFQDFHWKEK